MQKNKKIVFIHQNMESGGAERQLVILAKQLKENTMVEYDSLRHHTEEDMDNSFNSLDISIWTYYPDDFYVPFIKEAGIKYRYFKEAQGNIKRIPFFIKLFNREKPDVVITFLSSESILATLLKICTKLKIVKKTFDLIVQENSITQKKNLRTRIRFFLYRFADYIVCNSTTQTNFLVNHYPHLSPKVTCIHNYIDIKYFTPNTTSFSQNDNQDEPQVWLTVARIAPPKNLLNYIRAISQVVNRLSSSAEKIPLQVFWVGRIENRAIYNSALSMIETLQLQKIFHFVPEQTDILPFYHKAFVFVLPSIYEGLPNVVCEAMSCGLPILCSDVSDHPYLVEQGENGFLFNPKDVDNMTEMMMKMYNLSSMERRKMGVKSREKAEKLFSENDFLKSYQRLMSV